MGPNNSFKPNLLRYTNNMAGRACHVVGSATQVGLTQALGLMSNSSTTTNDSLRTAGWLLLAEIAGGVILSLALQRAGYIPELSMPVVWAANFVAAWHLSKAATSMRKNRWLYGLGAALGPPAAIFAYFNLKTQDTLHRLDRSW